MSKELVQKWIKDGCDYEKGCELFVKFGKNKVLARLFPGRQNRYDMKLKYELCKAVGLSEEYKKLKPAMIVDRKTIVLPPKAAKNKAPIKPKKEKEKENTAPKTKDKSSKKEAELPKEVKMVIAEYSKLTAERSKLHDKMVKIEGNDQLSVKTRKDLSDQIESKSNLIEILFAVKEAYFNDKVIPNIEELFAEKKETSAKKETEEEVLPDTEEELKKMKVGIQRSLSKDKNLLEYQKESKQKKVNKMPEGPKRLGIEKRIAKKEKTIENINYKLVELAG